MSLDFWDWIILCITTALIFADWLIGERGRSRIKERIACWWIWVSDFGVSEVFSYSARRVRYAVIWVFGENILSIRFIAISVGVTIGLIAIPFVSNFSWLVGSYQQFEPASNFIEAATVVLADMFAHGWGYFLLAALSGWGSLVVTFGLLKIIQEGKNWWKNVLIVLVDLGMAVLIFFAVRAGGAIVLFDFELGAALDTVTHVYTPGSWNFVSFGPITGDDLFMLLVVSIIPSLLHIGMEIILFLSKLTEPVLQPVTSLLLLRFHESSKGAFMLLAVGIGAIFKLIYEGLKLL